MKVMNQSNLEIINSDKAWINFNYWLFEKNFKINALKLGYVK